MSGKQRGRGSAESGHQHGEMNWFLELVEEI